MKKLVCGTAVAMTLALAFPGPTEAQSPPPVQPGGPPAQTQAAPPPTPYTVPRTTTVVKKTTVRRRSRTRSRSSSDNIANRLNAQELGGAGHGAAMAPYGARPHPIPVAGPGYPPPPFFRPPPPIWYPPPRPLFWRPWRPWRPYWWW
jgi:hypothetical protein